MPTEAEEVWRFTQISDFDLDRYTPATNPPGATGVPAPLAPLLAAVGARAALVVTYNGWVRHVELDAALRAQGVRVGGLDVLGDAAADALAAGSPPADAFGELAGAFLPDAVVVDVPAGVAVADPIVVLHWIDADGLAVFPRTLIRAGAQSEVTILDHYASGDVAAYVDPVIDIAAGDAAHVRYLTVQDLGPRVWQTAYQGSRVGRDATLTSAAVALGGDYARLRIDARLPGQGGTASLLAVYFGEGDQTHDFRTLQDHEGTHTTSELVFKGAVVDRAHGVYTGMIRVRKGAIATLAGQTNRNLVLSEGARADSIPNLEILENDLRGCNHASATGPVDEEQRFYLEARGIPPGIAERLIVLGFFDDVLVRMPVPGVRDLLRYAVARKLEGVLD
jgi:Fe-S cluster assembly protein SufD